VIQPTTLPQSLERFEGQDVFLPIAYGTGFVVSDAGYVVTALHVVRSAESRLPNIQSAGKQMVVCLGASPEPLDCKEVKIVGTDERNDLALLKIKRPNPAEMLHAMHLGSERPALGTEVWAAGYPARTGGRLVVALGTFSNGDLPDDGVAEDEPAAPARKMWLADMAVEDGTSGGPVYLHDGSVIGVVVTRSEAHTVAGFVPAQFVIDLLVRNGVANPAANNSPRTVPPGP
jgi:serine protease Do